MLKKLVALLLYNSLISQGHASIITFDETNQFSTGNSAEYIYKNYPSQSLIQIKLLGAVKNSGIYHVPEKTKISTLLSLAGGISENANTEKIIIGNDIKKQNKLINLEKILENRNGNEDELIANDIVFVKNKTPMINNEVGHSLSLVSIFLTSVLTAVVIGEKTKK